MSTTSWLSEMPLRISAVPDKLVVRNILLATDFSQCSVRALDCALGIASRYEAQLTLFHCVDPVPFSLVGPDAVWKTVDDIQSELEQLVSDLRRQHRINGLNVEVVVEIGDAKAVLPQVARDLKSDLIVVGTHGRTGWEKMLLGSVTEVVIDQAPCPVLSVGSSAVRVRMPAYGPENIVFVSEASRRSQLAESYAFSLASKYRARLTAIDVLENRFGRVVAQVSDLRWEETGSENTTPDVALMPDEDQPVEVGKESSLILATANRSAADLIVLAVPEGQRFTDRFLSTDSYRVVCGSPCPVLTVRAR